VAGGHDQKATPFGSNEPGMIKHLTLLENFLAGRFVTRAPVQTVLLVLFALCVLTATILQFVQSAVRSFLLFIFLLLAYYEIAAELFVRYDYQLDVAMPALGLLGTFLVSMTYNYFVTGRRGRMVRGMFQKYMSPELVAKLIEDPEAIKLGGERRELTAFFSDLANFTSLSEKVEPEELMVIINEYLALMTDDIIGCGGFLDKYQGDGIMGVFGVYPGQADHAFDACRAAIGNQRSIRVLQERWSKEEKPDVHVRIGINSGPMIAGNVGSEAKMNYTVLGDAVNLAARLESANKQFGTLVMIAEGTYKAVKDRVFARKLDLLAVKGKQRGVQVYELLGIKGEDLLTEQQFRLLDEFAKAVTFYQAQKFEKAIECFERGLEIVPDDGPCNAYIKRCKVYAANPPGEGWDGVFRLTTK